MHRSSHRFQYSAQDIHKAAEAEALYHLGRVAWWATEEEKAIKKAEETGIEVRKHDVTGGVQVEVVVDPTVTNRLSQCASKIQEHQRAGDRFAIEAAAYGGQPGKVYELDPDDVVYFRLAGGSREE